ncbi:hypothetical protein XHV734_0289 [Xanthomonas hortorum pv. vitians]|nr:hypothetical protein XHV734_0289 [Xanthomonas hortorum pv. vitians]
MPQLSAGNQRVPCARHRVIQRAEYHLHRPDDLSAALSAGAARVRVSGRGHCREQKIPFKSMY